MAATATLGDLVTAVRAEAGHSLAAYQGVNALETLRHEIRRTEYELWTAFQWPTLEMFREIAAVPDQFIYSYPVDLGFDQIRSMQWAAENSSNWQTISFGVPKECIAPGGGNSISGPHAQYWGVLDDTRFRVWPTPTVRGWIRLWGMKPLNQMTTDTDFCTLDPTLLILFTSAELLSRAKAADAELKNQKAQRHLQQLLGNKVSAKMKVSTFGSPRSPQASRTLRVGIDYIPSNH